MPQPDKRSEVPARMWDEDSPMPNVFTMSTGDRQDGERTYVAVDALLTDDALIAAATAGRSARDQIEYFGASDYDGPAPTEAALRAAIAHATQEATDAHRPEQHPRPRKDPGLRRHRRNGVRRPRD